MVWWCCPPKTKTHRPFRTGPSTRRSNRVCSRPAAGTGTGSQATMCVCVFPAAQARAVGRRGADRPARRHRRRPRPCAQVGQGQESMPGAGQARQGAHPAPTTYNPFNNLPKQPSNGRPKPTPMVGFTPTAAGLGRFPRPSPRFSLLAAPLHSPLFSLSSPPSSLLSPPPHRPGRCRQPFNALRC